MTHNSRTCHICLRHREIDTELPDARLDLAARDDARMLDESRESFYEELDKLPLVKGGQGRPDWTPDASFTVLDVAIVAACVAAGFAVLAATVRVW